MEPIKISKQNRMSRADRSPQTYSQPQEGIPTSTLTPRRNEPGSGLKQKQSAFTAAVQSGQGSE
jgi:hypothetical protein